MSVAAWRVPFGEAGILELFLGIIGAEYTHGDLALHSLRLIGNTCIDVGRFYSCSEY